MDYSSVLLDIRNVLYVIAIFIAVSFVSNIFRGR